MKIGVFGDSFADKDSQEIWWQYLIHSHGHDVESFGEPGSGISYSARLIKKLHNDYDFIIWCSTSPNRTTIYHDNKSYHVTGRHHRQLDDPTLQKKIDIAENYLLEVFNWDDGDFVGQCIVECLMNQIPNLMIVPSFPLGSFFNDFNLFQLCTIESNFYFPNKEVAEIYDEYLDVRNGHLTPENQKILANLINANLNPGIFNATYSDFVSPTTSIEKVFIKK